MSEYGCNNLYVTYDGHDVTPYIQKINDIEVENIMRDAKAFGEVQNSLEATGAQNWPNIVFGGAYDDGNQAPVALWDVAKLTAPAPGDAAKTLIISLGGSPANIYTIPVKPHKFKTTYEKNGVYEYEATLAKAKGTATKT